MEDPIITSLARPLSKEEKQNQKVINFAEQDFFVGVAALINDQLSTVPAEVGRLYAEYRKYIQRDDGTYDIETQELTLSTCADYVTPDSVDNSDDAIQYAMDA